MMDTNKKGIEELYAEIVEELIIHKKFCMIETNHFLKKLGFMKTSFNDKICKKIETIFENIPQNIEYYNIIFEEEIDIAKITFWYNLLFFIYKDEVSLEKYNFIKKLKLNIEEKKFSLRKMIPSIKDNCEYERLKYILKRFSIELDNLKYEQTNKFLSIDDFYKIETQKLVGFINEDEENNFEYTFNNFFEEVYENIPKGNKFNKELSNQQDSLTDPFLE
jgi:hypothetical protein